MTSKRPHFLEPVSASEPAPPRTPRHAQAQVQFEKLHARVCSRNYADDMDIKLSLISHELKLILPLLTERITR